MPEIISRKKAMASGLKRYFTGKPCRHGHISERRVPYGTCKGCDKAKSKRWRDSDPDRALRLARKRRTENGEKIRQAERKYWSKNFELLNERRRENYAKNVEKERKKARERAVKYVEKSRKYQKERFIKIRDLLEVLRAESPDLLKEFGL